MTQGSRGGTVQSRRSGDRTAAARRIVRRTRREQGLPLQVTDEVVLAAIARTMTVAASAGPGRGAVTDVDSPYAESERAEAA